MAGIEVRVCFGHLPIILYVASQLARFRSSSAVERSPVKRDVAGSNPASGAKQTNISNMSTIRFKAKLLRPDATAKIGSLALLMLPKSASAKLPSRGMTMVEGTVNRVRFRAPLEPDGKGSHWFRVNKPMREAIGADAGDIVTLEVEPAREWPEPKVPADLKKALAADSKAYALWMDTTTIARWDWIRWMDLAKRYETRRQRPEKLCAMLKAGKRRPCCFNRALPTLPKSASLLDSLQGPR